MPTFRLEIEYEGTRYRGWRMEHMQKTIQGEMLSAARQMFSVKPEISAAEDTEAGVHAYANVLHLKLAELNEEVTPKQIQQRFNDNLPHDINIKSLRNAPDDFHSRKNLSTKVYLYQMATRRTAFAKSFVWWLKENTTVAEMREAAEKIVGTHDFQSFCDAEDEGGRKAQTKITIEKAEIFTDGDLICFRIAAKNFPPKMIQRLVGTLAEIGRRKYTVEDFVRLIKFRSDAPKKFSAPPSGLFLEKILFEGEKMPDDQRAIVSI